MKTQTRPKTEYRVLDSSPKGASGLGFVSRSQTGAFALCGLTLLVSPYLFSSFWPVTHDLGTQSFFSVLAACAALLLALSPRDEAQKLSALSLPTKLLLAFFAWCFLSCAASVYWHDTILEIARIGTCAAWFLVLRETLRCGNCDNRVLERRALCLILAAVCGLAIVCARALLNFFETRDPRQFGTFANPNWFANACAMTLPLALCATLLAWRIARRQRPQIAPLVVSVGALLSFLILIGLAITSSKGGFLAAIIALIVFVVGLWRAQKTNLRKVWRANRVLVSVALISVLVVGAILVTKTVLPRLAQARNADDNSTMFRVYTWKSTLQMAKSRPVFGWAPGGFATVHDRFAIVGTTKTAHQSWLQIAAENGFSALILLVGATILFLARGWKNLKTKNWPQSLGAICAVVAFAVHGLTDAGWSISSIAFLLMFAFVLLDSSVEKTNIEYSNAKVSTENASRLRWNWLAVVLLTGAFSYAAQRAANGEDARDESVQSQRNGNALAALQSAQEASETDVFSSRIWTRLAQVKLASGDFAGAENAFARATKLNALGSVAWRSWAEARDEMPQSSTRTPATATLWDNAVGNAPRETSARLARARWRLKQNANDAQAWNDLDFVVRQRDAPYGRYAAVGDYINLDYARASVLLIPRVAKTDKTRAKSWVQSALKDVEAAEGKVAHQQEVAAANPDAESNLGPPRDLDELKSALETLQASQ